MGAADRDRNRRELGWKNMEKVGRWATYLKLTMGGYAAKEAADQKKGRKVG